MVLRLRLSLILVFATLGVPSEPLDLALDRWKGPSGTELSPRSPRRWHRIRPCMMHSKGPGKEGRFRPRTVRLTLMSSVCTCLLFVESLKEAVELGSARRANSGGPIDAQGRQLGSAGDRCSGCRTTTT